MIEATIAAEDARFRSHPGVDPIAIARSIVTLPVRRSGASTLTQQIARRLYLQGGAGMPLPERKAREALIALQLEARYSKDEILELYLNDVYYGRGAYGVEAASRVYFGISARNLDYAQAALLAGLPQLPGLYGAAPEAQAVEARRAYVIGRLFSTGKLSVADAGTAYREKLALLPELAPAIAPHFVTYALDELRRLRPDLAARSDIVIETTLDAGLQQETERLVKASLAQLADRNAGRAAVVVQDPSSGALLTMVGGDYAAEGDGQVNLALAARQPGSALKPFLYAAALERGYTAASPLLDVPSTFQTPTGPYTPLDYDRRFRGVVPMRVALASSLNVPAVQTLDALGIDAFLETAHRFGLSTLTDAEVYGLALTLGGGEVRLLDLTNAYAALANGGLLPAPYAVQRVRDARGNVLYEHQAPQPSPAVSPQVAFVIGDMLSDAIAREPGFGEARTLLLPFTAASKTGTTTEFHDNWTVGYTPQRAVGVWVGNADNSPMRGVSGLDGAGPIWRAVMLASMRGVTPAWPSAPSGIVRATVCAPTGLKPGPDCPSPAEEWFIAGTEPEATERYYARDAFGRLQVNPPAEARAWAASAGLSLSQDAPVKQTSLSLQPAPGTVLVLAPELQRQGYVLRASPPAGATSVEFWLDGSLAGRAPAGDPALVWTPVPGRHRLEARTVLGNGDTISAFSDFEVRP
jgi:penicillin-binding protein 1C